MREAIGVHSRANGTTQLRNVTSDGTFRNTAADEAHARTWHGPRAQSVPHLDPVETRRRSDPLEPHGPLLHPPHPPLDLQLLEMAERLGE